VQGQNPIWKFLKKDKKKARRAPRFKITTKGGWRSALKDCKPSVHNHFLKYYLACQANQGLTALVPVR
jgi:hypothetical protein